MKELEAINALDLAFVVDTTGSMSGLIQTAKEQMVAMLTRLIQTAQVAIDMQLGVVEYRDHPPQERSFVYNVHPFTGKMKDAQGMINDLGLGGGGDLPEAVFDGILGACRELEWRKHARRLLVLVGDAPPHGMGIGGDSFAKGCPCGETIESVTAVAEEADITIYALGMRQEANDSFTRISQATGGEFFATARNEDAIARLQAILVKEFSQIDFDRRLLTLWQTHRSLDILAEQLASSRPAVAAAISRLGARGLLQ
jgi:Mg-chelatase subunit ChlD